MGERAIRIEADGVRLYAILRDTATAAEVWDALPLEGRARAGAGEISFETGVRTATGAAPGASGSEPGAAPATGDLAYRPRGQAIVMVFGAPPDAAAADAGAAAGGVVFGRITGDATRLARVKDGARVRMTALEG